MVDELRRFGLDTDKLSMGTFGSVPQALRSSRSSSLRISDQHASHRGEGCGMTLVTAAEPETSGDGDQDRE